MTNNSEYLTPECNLAEFLALLRLGITDDLPDAFEVADHYLGFAFKRLALEGDTASLGSNAIWIGAPPQERTDVIRKALAIAYSLDPTHGVIWSREWPVGWVHSPEGQPAAAWVLRCAEGAVMFSADLDALPFSHAAGMTRITVHSVAVETETNARTALALAVQHRLSEV